MKPNNDNTKARHLLVCSPDPAEKLGGIYAIDELIDVQLGENAAKFSRFANYLRELPFAIGTPCDTAIVNASVDTLGHLVRTGGALTADVVEFEVRASTPALELPLPPFPSGELKQQQLQMQL